MQRMYDLPLLITDSNFKILHAGGCHDLTMLSGNTSDITIITVKSDYCCNIHNISN